MTYIYMIEYLYTCIFIIDLDRKLHLLLLRVSRIVSDHQATKTETIRQVLYSHICSRTACYKLLEKRISPQIAHIYLFIH